MTVTAQARNYKHELSLLRGLARRVSIQYAVYSFIHWSGGATLKEIYYAYCQAAGRVVRLSTVQNQLKQLERKGIVKRRNNEYYAVIPPELAKTLFDAKRSRAGRKGGLTRALSSTLRRERIPAGLKKAVMLVLKRVSREISRGRPEAALDILVHTLLPLRKTAVLWCRHRDVFVYYEQKTRLFHAVRSPWLAKLFDRLGFRDGILVWHALGHARAKKIIRDLFGRFQSWAWGRSIGHALMRLGFIEPWHTSIIEVQWAGNTLFFYTYSVEQTLLARYAFFWPHSWLPPPLSGDRLRVQAVALAGTHVKQSNQETYFARWLG